MQTILFPSYCELLSLINNTVLYTFITVTNTFTFANNTYFTFTNNTIILTALIKQYTLTDDTG